ncbi:hypothetical protein KFL_006810040 [Klebsormidium nitens]|uniref:Uncharacterized protein n=1 Tax=Klebsormidium nitens TaxID=105231 RepID=A0A1Y1IRK8_KLENI|nr:hypothetical protein KFL_006810040 [Klebsormidium nitens]|eukprot:GAQ90758.1 hypothetical protein KFL_006810040 [Klebsormidium nitens]
MLLMSVVLLLAFVLQPQATALASWGLSYAGDGQQGNLEVSELGVKSESERDLDGQDSQEEGKAGSNVHKRLLVRTEGTNTAGLGSILAQSRRSAVFAELVQARLIIPGIQSDHGYTPADLINRAINSSWELPSNPTVCRATMLLPAGEIEKILEAWCDSRDDELGKTLLRVYESCHVILDDRPWEVSYAFSRCTWRWTRKVLLGSESEGVKTTKGSVGLHLRELQRVQSVQL